MRLRANEQKIVDACRFCWMCRHVCPVGNATGQERNNARARALSLSLLSRGQSLTRDQVENIYECALCGACTGDCATGFDPTRFVKAARAEAAAEGLTPGPVVRILERMKRSGNPYGAVALAPVLEEEISSLPSKAPILLYLGSSARYQTPEAAVTAIRLLKKAKVDFTVMRDEPDSGLYKVNLLGPVAEAREDLVRAAELINSTGAETLVAYSPSSAKAFLRDYPELNVPLFPQIRTFTSYLNTLIQKGALVPTKGEISVTYHDPCALSRDLEEVDCAREILGACGLLSEMFLHGKDTSCCGSGLMDLYAPQITEQTSTARWSDAQRTGAQVLVTACPSCYTVFAKTKPEGMRLCSIETVLFEACK